MFNIKFTPQSSDAKLEMSKTGETLTINGVDADFSDMPDGADYPAESIESDFVLGGISKVDGVVHMTIIMPYIHTDDIPESVSYPSGVFVEQDGRISLPTDILPELETSIESPEDED